MSFTDAKVSQLKCTRSKGDWFAELDGQRVGIDWDEPIYDHDWDYHYQGVNGKLVFLEIHDGDDPYFSSQKDADKQLMHSLNLDPSQEFIRHMYAFVGDEEVNLGDIIVKE